MTGANPLTIMKAAASGDLNGHRAMATHLMEYAERESDPVAVIQALVFARLAATFGHEPDARRLLHILSRAADMHSDNADFCIQIRAEALAHASILADNGCDLTADSIAENAGNIPRKAVEMSHLFRERLLTA